MFTSALLLSVLPLLALASPQGIYGGGPPVAAPAASSSAPPTAATAPPNTAGQMNVNVAFQENFIFSPSNFSAPNGTLVTFFFPNAGLQHSVTQGDFASPCVPLASSSNGTSGFDSGLTENTQFTINITNDQIPIYFFCKFPLHCGMGMVGSINAPTSGNGTFDEWQAAAVKIGGSEQTITDNGFQSGGVGALATAAPTNTAAPSASSGSSGNGAARLVSGSSAALVAVAAAIAMLA
ncbi:hypothetical protein CERSUDRAFT_153610 [Gelatoporia subvermispora B]|uniref:Blue (type 1) copper domain-containing protein n=1 Tax=Ceriporiopsis subvermispora (strain B) TaxID=914234 RepID=M2R266_CERS8|nr:hypothetical protein CERSUDRAFT_153610 [Gelatoporia subvermispora B]